jgi:hypothetical protein
LYPAFMDGAQFLLRQARQMECVLWCLHHFNSHFSGKLRALAEILEIQSPTICTM